ncbi:MAG: hypothetical protein PHW01_02050 [Patescibacteria group bacterium]|nr:hypothetical protein [Patescibacteria group bacterium]
MEAKLFFKNVFSRLSSLDHKVKLLFKALIIGIPFSIVLVLSTNYVPYGSIAIIIVCQAFITGCLYVTYLLWLNHGIKVHNFIKKFRILSLENKVIEIFGISFFLVIAFELAYFLFGFLFNIAKVIQKFSL